MSGLGANITKLSCRYHPEADLVDDYHAGDVVCSDCGLVVGDRIIDVSSEWRTFGNDSDSKDMSRVGAAENPLGGNDLSTCIESGKGDSSMKTYSNRRTTSSGERALQLAFKEIKLIAERLYLPRVISDHAMHLFKQVHESKTLKGRSNDAILTACLYIECRRENAPRTLKEICGASKVSKKDIGRAFKLIVKFMNTNVDLISSADFLSRFCSLLGLTSSVHKAAVHIADKANAMNLVSGRSPISVAAAAIYMAAQAGDCKKTAKEIGDVTGVAEATIKQSYRLIYPSAQELFPEDFKFTTSIEHLSAL